MIKELEVRELKLQSKASPANLNLRPLIVTTKDHIINI